MARAVARRRRIPRLSDLVLSGAGGGAYLALAATPGSFFFDVTNYVQNDDLDWQPAIQRAVADANAVGAGVVYLPRLKKTLPTYQISPSGGNTIYIPSAVVTGLKFGMAITGAAGIPGGATVSGVGNTGPVRTRWLRTT